LIFDSLVRGQQPVDDRTQRALIIDELSPNRAWEQKARFP